MSAPGETPLSIVQRAALRKLLAGPLIRRIDGWARDGEIVAFASTTVYALAHRGYVDLIQGARKKDQSAVLTTTGRSKAKALREKQN